MWTCWLLLGGLFAVYDAWIQVAEEMAKRL